MDTKLFGHKESWMPIWLDAKRDECSSASCTVMDSYRDKMVSLELIQSMEDITMQE